MVFNVPSPIPVSIPSHFPVLAMLCLLSILHTLSLQRIAWHSRVCSIPLANLLDESIHSKVRTHWGLQKKFETWISNKPCEGSNPSEGWIYCH